MKKLIIKIISFSLLSILMVNGCNNNSNRKIQLSENISDSVDVETTQSVIQVEKQTTVAIFAFKNASNDTNLNWLQRGITDMIKTELDQSPYINVVPVQHLFDIGRKFGFRDKDVHNTSFALKIAKKAMADRILLGQYYVTDSLYIDLTMTDVATKKEISNERVSGSGLEQIFSMVNDLSDRMRVNLRNEFVPGKKYVESEDDTRLVDRTKSLEAYRCLSQGFGNIEKFLWADAEECLEKAIKNDNTFAEAYLHLAIVKYKIGDSRGGTAALENARKYSHKLSKQGKIQLKMITALRDQNVELWIKMVDEMLKLAPYDIEIRSQLASHLMEWGRFDRALKEYETILELDSSDNIVYNQIGYIYARRGDFTNAVRYIEEYKRRERGEANPFDSMGEVLLMAGRFEESAEQLKTAIEIQPDYYFSAQHLSRIYSELGNLEKAKEYFDYTLEKAPSEGVKHEAYLSLAQLYWRFNKIKEAEKALQMANEIAPGYLSAVMIAGEMYKSMGDLESANEVYLDYFEKNKDNVASKKWDNSRISIFLNFCLEASIPPEKVIPVLTTLYEKEDGNFLKSNYRNSLGLFHLRNKDFEKAASYFEEMDSHFADILMEVPNIGWSGWKFINESICLIPNKKSSDHRYFDEIVKKAQKKNRLDIEILARFSRAMILDKQDQENEFFTEYQKLGTPLEKDWRVIGPFKNEAGFVNSFFPEESNSFTSVKVDDQTLDWQSADDGAYDGYVDLRSIFDQSSWSVGYGTIYVKSPKRRVVQLRLSTDESCKLWFNDDLVWQVYRLKGETPVDADIVSVVLHEGYNKLLIKVTNGMGDWGFNVRVTNEKGEGFTDIEFYPPDKVAEEIVLSN